MLKKNQIFNLIYYSHIYLALMAMVLSGAINLVLTRQVTWPAVIFIGMATFLTYSIDNLVDWQRDRTRYLDEEKMIRVYHKVSIVLIFLCILGTIWFMTTSNFASIIGSALLACAVLFSILRVPPWKDVEKQKIQSIEAFLFNRAFISLVWTIICVFIPLWYAAEPIKLQVWSTSIYLWMLLFIYAVIWKQEKSSQFLQQALNSSSIRNFLQLLCVCAILLPIENILVERITPMNMVNVLPPLVFYILLEKYHLAWRKARQQLIRIAVLLGFVILIVIVFHLILGNN